MLRLIYLSILVVSLSSCKKSKNEVSTSLQVERTTVDPLAPIMLDDIHYYTQNRMACNAYFEINFGSRAMLEKGPNPFEFIDFQLLRSGQSTINISKRGPFPGIAVGDPKRWERVYDPPSADNPPRYGVHWLALSSPNLENTIQSLERNQVHIIDKYFKLPHHDGRAILCEGPDYNHIVVTEDIDNSNASRYTIDHLLLLVEDLDDNLRFYSEVFRGTIMEQTDHYASMSIGGHKFILAEPEGLGLDRIDVLRRDPKVYRPDIDHLGFLYRDVQPAYDHAVSLGYKFLAPPNKIEYYDKPTLYTFAITFSPDGLQCEMYQEDGRTSSRTKYKS